MRLECGCETRLSRPLDRPNTDSYIVMCPLHEAAPKLREALQRIVHETIDEMPPTRSAIEQAANLIDQLDAAEMTRGCHPCKNCGKPVADSVGRCNFCSAAAEAKK